jgi:hypothetical protein
MTAKILYHIFSSLGPKIALPTLKFWDQFSCRLYRNHHCCGIGGKKEQYDEPSVNAAQSVIASDRRACPEPCPEQGRRGSRRGAKQSPDLAKRDCFVADTFASLSAWFILSLVLVWKPAGRAPTPGVRRPFGCAQDRRGSRLCWGFQTETSPACPACPESCPEQGRRDSRGEPRRRIEGLLAMKVPLTILGYTPIEARIDIQCNLWYASQRCNPDHDTHKDALLVSIQGPSLAAAGLNALGIGGCAWAEPILHGSALAFFTLGTLANKKRQPVPDQERHRLACWSPGENIQTTWRECMVFSGLRTGPSVSRPRVLNHLQRKSVVYLFL